MRRRSRRTRQAATAIIPSAARGSHLIPFLVADRKASLRIVRKIPFLHYAGPIGLMAHANTTQPFKEAFRRFPCGPALCDNARAIRGEKRCHSCSTLADRTIKMVDSGVFTKEGCEFDYESLYRTYTSMGADYGIMIDVIRDSKATINSARKAIATFKRLRPRFKLVGVAQGKSIREYVACYETLKRLGFDRIAIGGMLAKRANTSHFAYVRADRKLYEVLAAIRARHPGDWLFALGCYHPKRHLRMERLGVFGSDYKGWIFNYVKRPGLRTSRARCSRYRQVRAFLSREVFDGPLYLNGAAKEVDTAMRTRRILGVVSCGGVKAWSKPGVVGPVRAEDAYTGPLFKAGRRYAEQFTSDWVILSAKYGLISPSFKIPGDYDVRLSWRRNSSQALALRKQLLAQELHRFSKVIVLGGHDYVESIADAYAGTGIPVFALNRHPTRIGQMIHLLNDAVKTGAPLASRPAC